MTFALKLPVLIIVLLFFSGNDFTGAFCAQVIEEGRNKVDAAGMRQGEWVITKEDKIIEEGSYVNNKKDGVWKAYFDNGQLKSEITFVNGEARGAAKFYYEDGTLREAGNWQVDHWEGSYQYYFESGQLSYDWFYNEDGKRQGEQRYYHENGKKLYQGHWEDGKTEGTLKVYNERGELVQEKLYANGKFAKTKEVEGTANVAIDEKFTGTGFHTVFNLNGKVDKKGFFVKGKLFNGEIYHYNENDSLVSVTLITNGVKNTQKD